MAHILLIEDDPGTADEIIRELTREGHRATHRTRICDSDTVLRDGTVDLLIVDRQLPDGEGLDLIARMRGEGRRTPVLV